MLILIIINFNDLTFTTAHNLSCIDKMKNYRSVREEIHPDCVLPLHAYMCVPPGTCKLPFLKQPFRRV